MTKTFFTKTLINKHMPIWYIFEQKKQQSNLWNVFKQWRHQNYMNKRRYVLHTFF